MRLTATIFGIRLLFLVTVPVGWILEAVDEEGERFPNIWKAVGRVEFMFKGLSLRCARMEHQAHATNIAKIERQIDKEFES